MACTLSKTKLLNFRQCPKRLWLEIHRPELRQDSSATQASFAVGHRVGEIARQLYDPKGKGTLLDPQTDGFEAAFARSLDLLTSAQPIFEAGFRAEGALAFADVMLPTRKAGKRVWRMVEVKSSTAVKDYHRDDAAVQSFVARAAGVPLAGIALAHVDSRWVYPGDRDYRGLLVENDLTDEAFGRDGEVRAWIAEAQRIVSREKAPAIDTGSRCGNPYDCPFLDHCRGQAPQAEYPVAWLPGVRSKALKSFIESTPACDLREVPDGLLNDIQRRVKAATLSGKPYFDAEGATQALRAHKLPAYFLDFETIQFAVPIWKGTRPYQQIPFQFSVHRISRTGKVEHRSFLDLSGADPSKAFAETLITACRERGSVFVYNAGFETARIRELAERFPHMKRDLLALNERIVDLLPVAREYYYHPDQQGSWSIKAVLPTLCLDLNHGTLDGVQDGVDAQTVCLEAIAPETASERKAEIERQLLAYCKLDTWATVKLWIFFTGNTIN